MLYIPSRVQHYSGPKDVMRRVAIRASMALAVFQVVSGGERLCRNSASAKVTCCAQLGL